MTIAQQHLSDEQLLLLLDREWNDELESLEQTAAYGHLESCADCQVRSAQMETTLGELARLTQDAQTSELPPASGPTALLKLRMQQQANTGRSWLRWFRSPLQLQPRVYVFASLVIAAVLLGVYRQKVPLASKFAIAYADEGRIPNRALTPGATRPVSLADICPAAEGGDTADLDPEVPSSTQRAVFQEYGIGAESSAINYQVDYLINPQLGGTNDVRNLWPEPYSSTVWNARVKDALEDRLHRMVCEQKIDLASAQRDLATDWIAAYKKYFHTSKPV